MSALGRWARKVAILVRKNQYAHELKEEIAFHHQHVEEDLRARGMSAEEAHRAAARQFGNTLQIRERSHEVVGFRWETVAQDVRFALRQLVRQPGFAVTAIAMLALAWEQAPRSSGLSTPP